MPSGLARRRSKVGVCCHVVQQICFFWGRGRGLGGTSGQHLNVAVPCTSPPLLCLRRGKVVALVRPRAIDALTDEEGRELPLLSPQNFSVIAEMEQKKPFEPSCRCKTIHTFGWSVPHHLRSLTLFSASTHPLLNPFTQPSLLYTHAASARCQGVDVDEDAPSTTHHSVFVCLLLVIVHRYLVIYRWILEAVSVAAMFGMVPVVMGACRQCMRNYDFNE